ncbi:opioid growth factor receptor-related protein [Vreelandella neptunia]|uniref:Opioid growth factor receptor-related protein n=1 Tax=Vreelandella neptunia TaxID=115551 RepID=A0ABS9S4H2_9GAMM|nr:opioid growth factor receptor-related protein [Halomonas neptunia]MCH4810903.1 opioid growth factor receptor-related protein [Halomonas neptunia]
MSHHPTPLIAFYRGQATDHQGRYINDIWALSHFWLEHTHDYIQWLFPIPEVGRFNHFAPRLTDVEREVFQDDSALREKQRVSLDVMLSFLGLTRDGITITAQPSLNIRDHIWLKAGGHNHLRISRIIRSLALCHQPKLAAAFQQAVIEIGSTQGIVSAQSMAYWRAASDAKHTV